MRFWHSRSYYNLDKTGHDFCQTNHYYSVWCRHNAHHLPHGNWHFSNNFCSRFDQCYRQHFRW